MSTQEQQQQTNGKPRITLPTFGCEGCERRKQIMGAGNWQVDVAVLLILAGLCVVLWKVKIA